MYVIKDPTTTTIVVSFLFLEQSDLGEKKRDDKGVHFSLQCQVIVHRCVEIKTKT